MTVTIAGSRYLSGDAGRTGPVFRGKLADLRNVCAGQADVAFRNFPVALPRSPMGSVAADHRFSAENW